jgi:NADH-quinone oxidoreductase subunit M
MLETGMIGAFFSLDIFLFYVFWEAMLIPMFFIIGVWGGKERIYASAKFMLYTIAGSLPMLVAIIYLLWQHKTQFGFFSASLLDLYKVALPGDGMLSSQALVFLAFCLAFAVKVPMFPLHTWLPDAHVQAPTGGSVILAGVLLKLGIYGFIRFAIPLAPEATVLYAPYFMVIAAVAIIYGACVAIVQTDIKKLVAYSSVSHMGYIVLGLFSMNAIGITGSVYQMLNHGISTGGLFLLVGILYERRHTREVSEFGGLASVIPLFAISLIILTMSSIALPGTNGFIGEFLILQGAFLANPYISAVAGLGVVLGAVYMLWLCQKVLFGVCSNKKNKGMADLSLREAGYLAPLLILVFVMGLYPKVFITKMEKSIAYFTETISTPGARYAPTVSFAQPVVAAEPQVSLNLDSSEMQRKRTEI